LWSSRSKRFPASATSKFSGDNLSMRVTDKAILFANSERHAILHLPLVPQLKEKSNSRCRWSGLRTDERIPRNMLLMHDLQEFLASQDPRYTPSVSIELAHIAARVLLLFKHFMTIIRLHQFLIQGFRCFLTRTVSTLFHLVLTFCPQLSFGKTIPM
jgi:hypothetical protein